MMMTIIRMKGEGDERRDDDAAFQSVLFLSV